MFGALYGTWPPPTYRGYLGLGLNSLWKLFAASLPAGGAAVIPGPGAGFVRLFDIINIPAAVLASPLATVNASLLPLGFALNGTTALSGTSAFLIPPAIGAGESIQITNGGANAGAVSVMYLDVPAAQYTLVRTTLNAIAPAAPAVLIAAPAAGFIARVVQAPRASTVTTVQIVPQWQWNNRDTVAHTLELFSGANLVGRSAAVAPGANIIQTPTGPQQLIASAALGAIQARLGEAIVTTAPVFFAMHETMRDPAALT